MGVYFLTDFVIEDYFGDKKDFEFEGDYDILDKIKGETAHVVDLMNGDFELPPNKKSRLGNPKYFIANWLEDIYTAILSQENHEFLFRGEAGVYGKPVASVYRQRNSDFIKMSEEFYSEVGADLSAIEDKNFLLYSQHHGLPTPLLDTSEVLNTALYFATNEDGDNSTNLGILHIFDKNKCIDITSQILNENNSKQGNLDIMKEYRNWFSKGKSEFFNSMVNHFYDSRTDFKSSYPKIVKQTLIYLKKNFSSSSNNRDVAQPYSEYELQYTKAIRNVISQFEKSRHQKNEPLILELNTELFDIFCERYKSCSTFRNMTFSGIVKTAYSSMMQTQYLYLLDMALFMLDNGFFREKTLTTLPPLPNFFIQPVTKFGRIRAQQGSFLFQISGKINLHILGKTNKRGFPDIANLKITFIQEINSMCRIIIFNKKTILKQLEYMGVNRGTIYLDPDNIALHIKNKHNKTK